MRRPWRLGRRRGSLLAQVLMGTAVLGYIAALTLQWALQAKTSAAAMTGSRRSALAARSAVDAVRAAWQVNGASCSSHRGLGVSCRGGNLCACSCRVSPWPDVAIASEGPREGPCSLSVSVP